MNPLEERCIDLYDSLDEAAEELNVTTCFLKQVIAGERKLDPPSIYVWSQVLNIPANDTARFFGN